MMAENGEMESIGAKVPAELKQKIRVKAAEEGMTMSNYIREALEEKAEEDDC